MEKNIFILDNKTNINEDDVVAFQSSDRYVAKDKNAGFNQRIAKGKINV